MNIIILTEKDRIDQNQFTISDERFIHISNILNAQTGDILEIGLLNDKIGKAKITFRSSNEIRLEIIELKNADESKINIDIVCALPRPQTLKKVLSISATMGVGQLFFIKSEKVEKSYFHSPMLLEDNYSKFLMEGLSQGKKINMTKVSFHKQFKKFFEDEFNPNNYDIKLLAHPDSEINLMNIKFYNSQNIALAIGPEGGWNDFEINFMRNFGFEKFLLSKSILRVESAVTAALSQIELLFFNKFL